MKALALLTATFLASPLAFGEPDSSVQNVRIDVQIVSIPRKLALPLVSDLAVDTKVEAAFAKIQEMIAAGTAQLIGWPLIITKTGQRAQIENIHEIRYATEFEAGGLAVHLTDKEGEVSKIPSEIDGVEISPTPSSFETRNAGVTLEVEPVVSPDRKLIDLNLVPQHVRLRGMRKNTIEHAKNGKTTVEQPEFETMKAETSLTLRNGQRVLLGMFPTDEPPDHIELFLLKAETREP